MLSFPNGTLVLSIGQTIEEVNDTGFQSSTPTLAVQQLGDAGLLQVHPYGLRHIRAADRVDEWSVPPGCSIVAATTNKRQVVIALSTNELVYFELDPEGSLSEYQEKKSLSGNATCLSISEVPEGRRRTPYLAVGCDDQTVHIISLEPDSTLATLSLQVRAGDHRTRAALTSGAHCTTFLHLPRRDFRHIHRQEPADHVPEYRSHKRCTAQNRRRPGRWFSLGHSFAIPRREAAQGRASQHSRFSSCDGIFEPKLAFVHLPRLAADPTNHLRSIGIRLDVLRQHVPGRLDWYFWQHIEVRLA